MSKEALGKMIGAAVMANMVPMEALLDKLKESIEKYEILPEGKDKEEAYDDMLMNCTLLLQKDMLKNEGLTGVINLMTKHVSDKELVERLKGEDTASSN